MSSQNAVEQNDEVLKSISFPFRKGGGSFPEVTTGTAVIHESLKGLISTGKNERIMDGEFGVNAHGYVFENISSLTFALIAADIKKAISEYEPRVNVLSINAFKADSNEAPRQTTILVEIEYSIGNQVYSQQVPIGHSVAG